MNELEEFKSQCDEETLRLISAFEEGVEQYRDGYFLWKTIACCSTSALFGVIASLVATLLLTKT